MIFMWIQPVVKAKPVRVGWGQNRNMTGKGLLKSKDIRIIEGTYERVTLICAEVNFSGPTGSGIYNYIF